jgi:hypothetical protein
LTRPLPAEHVKVASNCVLLEAPLRPVQRHLVTTRLLQRTPVRERQAW